jgi:ABC-type multidrug transport system ATPase subunit
MLMIENVVKRYGDTVTAVDRVSLNLNAGVVGLIGHNGAGKTSLINMIATITATTSGRIVFDGADIARTPDVIRRRLGFLPQEFGVHAHISARDFLAYLAGLKGVRDPKRVDQCLAMVNLEPFARRSLRTFSGGMRRRLGIAQALLNDPAILIVDEPTTGLDLEERQRFRDLVSQLGASKLVIVSTHIVSDIEHIATELAVMRNGKLVAQASPQAIMARAHGTVWSALLDAGEVAQLRASVHILHAQQRADGVLVRMAHPHPPCAGALAQEPSLEDALMAQARGITEQAA